LHPSCPSGEVGKIVRNAADGLLDKYCDLQNRSMQRAWNGE
jgi:hypothetical protein